MPTIDDIRANSFFDADDGKQIKLSKAELRKFKKYKGLSDEELEEVSNTLYQLALMLYESMNIGQ